MRRVVPLNNCYIAELISLLCDCCRKRCSLCSRARARRASTRGVCSPVPWWGSCDANLYGRYWTVPTPSRTSTRVSGSAPSVSRMISERLDWYVKLWHLRRKDGVNKCSVDCRCNDVPCSWGLSVYIQRASSCVPYCRNMFFLGSKV